ncbi:MAG: alkaline phosphatase family protein [Armatimonadota bacterium]|nr:alkaline phosphatase family protein [Armatimonadota bacterium]MDR7487100.1 alkaline phosphatase family protein [Armatimonadota bacterium]MDR7535820.1 alkaline phosphatase family protein [Armatimonadota bacterium]
MRVAVRPALAVAMLAAALALLALAAAAPGRGSPGLPARHVVVLSLDGARPDALRAAMSPALAARGAVSWTARTTLPSVTLPAHASMLSGVGPGVHGVRVNDWQVGQPYFERPTVFTEVTRAGRRAVGLVAKGKLLMLMPPGSVAAARHLVYPRYRQADVVEEAAAVFAAQRPALLFVHVADPDDAGHRFGWMGPEYLQVIAGIPALVERLLRALDAGGAGSESLLLVTADHGGHGRIHGTSRPEDVTIPWLAFGGAARPGVAIEREIVTYDTAATVLAALGLPAPGDWQGRPVREALR